VIGPGGEELLRLRSDKFRFEDAIKARVRLTAEGVEPWEGELAVSVHRSDDTAAEFEAAVSREGTWISGTHPPDRA
jgi:hypothetical protein